MSCAVLHVLGVSTANDGRHLHILGRTVPCMQPSRHARESPLSVCVSLDRWIAGDTPYDVVQQSASTYTSLVCWCVDTLASMHSRVYHILLE